MDRIADLYTFVFLSILRYLFLHIMRLRQPKLQNALIICSRTTLLHWIFITCYAIKLINFFDRPLINLQFAFNVTMCAKVKNCDGIILKESNLERTLARGQNCL